MMVVEVFVTEGALTAEQRRRLAERMLTELMAEESAPESVMDGARRLTHVLVHEPQTWVSGGADAPRYLVRLTVPGSWNNKELGAHLIPRITALIAEFEDDPQRLYREPHCLVQIVGLHEHSVGTLGRVTTSTDITKLITSDYRESAAQAEAAPGTAIDPVCGMTVDLATATFTLEHDGTTYAFCAPVCRKVFAEELAG